MTLPLDLTGGCPGHLLEPTAEMGQALEMHSSLQGICFYRQNMFRIINAKFMILVELLLKLKTLCNIINNNKMHNNVINKTEVAE